MDFSAFDIAQRSHTVFCTVDRHVGIPRCILRHRFENTARSREESRMTMLIGVRLLTDGNAAGFQPFCQFFKSQYRVDSTLVMVCFVLFRYARTDKHCFRVRITLFNIPAVCLHRGHNIRQIRQRALEVLLNQQIDRMAAGGNQDITISLSENALIFGFDNRHTNSSFFHISKAKLFQCFPHSADAGAVIICRKGGRKADDNRAAALEQNFYLFGFVHDFLCILRTYNKALTAQNTFVSDDMRLIAGEAYRLYRTVAYTFIAVFTV